jgi:hypothetical protein
MTGPSDIDLFDIGAAEEKTAKVDRATAMLWKYMTAMYSNSL